MKTGTILSFWTTLVFGLSQGSLEDKLLEIRERHLNGADTTKQFDIEQEEANNYLRNQTVSQAPDGFENPWIRVEENIAVMGATLNLDNLDRGKLPDSMVFQLLSGRIPVELSTSVSGESGIGRIEITRVTLSGIVVPAEIVTSLLSDDDITVLLPPGFRIGEPFPLPFSLESIDCRVGVIIVSQRAKLGFQ